MTVKEFLTEAFSRCNTVKNGYFCSYGDTELDYARFDNVGYGPNQVVEIDDWFDVSVTPGACEGAYIEIYMVHTGDHETTRCCVGVIKTLQITLDAYRDLGKLAGELLYHMLHVNIHGK